MDSSSSSTSSNSRITSDNYSTAGFFGCCISYAFPAFLGPSVSMTMLFLMAFRTHLDYRLPVCVGDEACPAIASPVNMVACSSVVVSTLHCSCKPPGPRLALEVCAMISQCSSRNSLSLSKAGSRASRIYAIVCSLIFARLLASES